MSALDPRDLFRLDGKVALVTGASSGLGVVFAEGLAAAGADLVIAARRAERLEQTRELVLAQGRRCLAVETDVTSAEQRERLVERAVAELGAVDVLVNNAGLATSVPASRESAEEFARVIDVNLQAPYGLAQACARVMVSGSSIVNVGSVLGAVNLGLPQAAYSSSKAAVVALSRDLAVQWTGRKGIRVNTLAPGIFPTEMTAEYDEGYVENLMPRIPAGRLGAPRELLGPLLFLASDASSYVTGTVLTVDGGLTTG